MENQKIMLIHAVPAAAQMRQVSKFNPLRFLKQDVSKETGEKKIKMDLRYKKLWFRLACPNGRLIHSAIRVTDQVAVFEARVFLNCEDALPVSTFTVSKSKDEVPGGNIVQAAQDSAMDEALDAAGFGIQLCEVDRSVIESDAAVRGSSENVPPSKSSPAPQASRRQLLGHRRRQPLPRQPVVLPHQKLSLQISSNPKSPHALPLPRIIRRQATVMSTEVKSPRPWIPFMY